MEKSANSKYRWQMFINGQLFADLTNLVQDRHFIFLRNAPDEISCTINLDALEQYATLLKVNSQDILQAGVAEIRVSRYGVVLTAGQLISWNAELADQRTITLNFKGWYDLLKFRYITKSYTGYTAFQILQDVINTTQAASNGNIGFTFGLVPAVDATVIYAQKDYVNKCIYDIFTELSNDNGGFDFEFTWDKKINVYYPQQGTTREDIVFSYPGTIQDIKISNDISKVVNSLTARGAGYGPAQISQLITDSASQIKFGLREGFLDHPDITDTAQLVNLGTSEVNLFKDVLTLRQIILDGTQDPQVGAFHLGDSIRVSVATLLRLYAGINNSYRIDKIDVVIGKEEEETVTVDTN